ncbi:phytoene/squalene synthase family protein [Rhodococcus spelaei]|uniref:Phytoene/squalene synthase family protein n=1 Tax=Rhodococcus spelaei TaxID=2546320 RepID=A0A541BMN7_9NOCA|nr:phytoene/squalene synthase family protein [Rhodococcus spelaei]TQF73582.1 phytoene/squalene synthase family protein [Rhodococcus spelaei]
MTALHDAGPGADLAGGDPADSDLAGAYRYCRQLAAEHGKSYYLATRLLPEQRRPAVHALYGFARTVDDLVDVEAGAGRPAADCLAELDRIESELLAAVAGAPRTGTRAVVLAVADTIGRYSIHLDHFTDFLASMRMDLPGAPDYRAVYATMGELRGYMHGSAAAIGLQMLPVLGTVTAVAEAEPAAAALGEAFQLTNFIRDVGEDLRRGRVYLPADELSAFGVDPDLLRDCQGAGTSDPRIERALAHFVAVNRDYYRRARPGLAMLEPRVRPGMTAAFELYSAILGEVEDGGYRVLDRRAVVAPRRRVALAAPRLLGSLVAAVR